MIPKTQAEKDALKAAKKACKQNQRNEQIERQQAKQRYDEEKTKEFVVISDKPFPGELPLDTDYPIYLGYTYVLQLQDGTYRAITSWLIGRPAALLADANKHETEPGNPAVAVLNCNRFARIRLKQ